MLKARQDHMEIQCEAVAEKCCGGLCSHQASKGPNHTTGADSFQRLPSCWNIIFMFYLFTQNRHAGVLRNVSNPETGIGGQGLHIANGYAEITSFLMSLQPKICRHQIKRRWCSQGLFDLYQLIVLHIEVHWMVRLSSSDLFTGTYLQQQGLAGVMVHLCFMAPWLFLFRLGPEGVELERTLGLAQGRIRFQWRHRRHRRAQAAVKGQRQVCEWFGAPRTTKTALRTATESATAAIVQTLRLLDQGGLGDLQARPYFPRRHVNLYARYILKYGSSSKHLILFMRFLVFLLSCIPLPASVFCWSFLLILRPRCSRMPTATPRPSWSEDLSRAERGFSDNMGQHGIIISSSTAVALESFRSTQSELRDQGSLWRSYRAVPVATTAVIAHTKKFPTLRITFSELWGLGHLIHRYSSARHAHTYIH